MTRRQQSIMDHLQHTETSSYDELATLFAVSTMTIRREVDRLASMGAVIKTLGGVQKAFSGPSSLMEVSLLSRLSRNRYLKQAIARTATCLLDDAHSLFIDGGTTCLGLAKLIAREKKGLTILTNSILICRELGQSSDNVVIGLGGEYDPASFSFAGSACEEEAAKYFVDVALFSTKGFRPDEGTYESFLPTIRIKQVIASHCHRVALLLDHTKFGKVALRKVFDVSQVSDVVTDSGVPAEVLAALRARGLRCWVAEPSGLEARALAGQ